MRRILIIVPELVAPPGILGQAVIESGFAYDAILPESRFASQSPLDYRGLPQEPGTYAGLIALGGPMSANDLGKHSFLTETMGLSVPFMRRISQSWALPWRLNHRPQLRRRGLSHGSFRIRLL